jgi:cupin fold WbuC family metalloprotein
MKSITTGLLDSLSARAAASPRRRMNHNLHDQLTDPVQRLLNAIEPGTYIRPHRHSEPPTWEVFVIVRGSAVFLTFDDEGVVQERRKLAAGGPDIGIEITADTWHTIVPLEPGSVFLEVKQGPYVPPQPRNAASWAPAEGDPLAPRFEAWFRTAVTGDRPLKKEE